MKHKFFPFLQNKFSRSLLVLSLFLSISPLYAADIVGTKVTGVRCADNELHYCVIYFKDKWTGTVDNCAQAISSTFTMYLDNSSPGGKAMLGVALAANAQDKTVVATSKATCNVVPGGADINYLMIAPKCADSFDTWGCEP